MRSAELEALERWRAGDPEGFERLYALTAPSLLAFCRLLAGNEADALDLVQDAWRQAVARQKGFRGESSFRTWLTALAYHRWVDGKRRGVLEKKGLEARREQARGEVSDPPDRHLLMREALAKLPAEEREAVLLYDLRGLSLRETAGILKVSHVAVRDRLARAHAALAKILKSP